MAAHGGSKLAAHPAAFPVGIPAGTIKHLTSRGERVLDPFLGSASSIVAAERLGRAGAGIEISPAYVAVSLERLEACGLTPRLVEAAQ